MSCTCSYCDPRRDQHFLAALQPGEAFDVGGVALTVDSAADASFVVTLAGERAEPFSRCPVCSSP